MPPPPQPTPIKPKPVSAQELSWRSGVQDRRQEQAKKTASPFNTGTNQALPSGSINFLS